MRRHCLQQEKNNLLRCDWAGSDPLYCRYHDEEWGEPVHDDRKLFEMLILEGFQAGLSWITILRKREAFRKAFKHFDWKKVSRFDEKDIERLLQNADIIRNRRKIEAAVRNAQAFQRLRQEFGTFDHYIWQFTDNRTIIPAKRAESFDTLPTHTPQSDAMSRDLKKRGFSFVGTVICYAFMQAIGMVDDHQRQCFKAIR